MYDSRVNGFAFERVPGMATSTDPAPDAFAGCLDGKVDFGEPTWMLYATDSSIHELTPVGGVTPANRDTVRRVVEYARECGVSVTPRGAGSSLIGGSVGEGAVLECECHLDATLAGAEWVE